jgi:hypothetical protein
MAQLESREFIEHAQSVLRRIETYERSGAHEIARNDLDTARREIGAMLASASMQGSPRERRYRTLTRMVVDQWPLGHALGIAISELEEEYARLFG